MASHRDPSAGLGKAVDDISCVLMRHVMSPQMPYIFALQLSSIVISVSAEKAKHDLKGSQRMRSIKLRLEITHSSVAWQT
ncbi:hypothetical protein M440DRAFT_1330166 [Trichoderma longibrachiatum ATCC 18648]|uniref:Uncharacterized protein n=1 Tax=Trichoderma longibrachiatum ATCC 18648 TaxID=983965 RepID=A0A2T4C700_TRILO|nr:hypothetical protein M440DRAFT_1330166 [Trichoderma longibrachiatum ATCC 18648]